MEIKIENIKKNLIISKRKGKEHIELYSNDNAFFQEKIEKMKKENIIFEVYEKKQANIKKGENVRYKNFTIDYGQSLKVYKGEKLIEERKMENNIFVYKIKELLFTSYNNALSYAKANKLALTSKKALIIQNKNHKTIPFSFTYEVWINNIFKEEFNIKEKAIKYALSIDTTSSDIEITRRGKWLIYINDELFSTVKVRNEVFRYLKILRDHLTVNDSITIHEELVTRIGKNVLERRTVFNTIPKYESLY